MSADEFLALGETDHRLELVDGVVVVSPSPQPLHQVIGRRFMHQFLSQEAALPGMQVFYETDIVLAPRLVYCPDICVYAPGRLAGIPARLALAPDLIVEILSPGNKPKDLVTKRDDYEKHGVGEYWVVEPTDTSIRVFRRAGGVLTQDPAPGTVVECRAVAGLRVDMAAVGRDIKLID